MHRDQLKNMGVRPYLARLKDSRAKTLVAAFPKYDAGLIEAYSRTTPLAD